MGRKIKDRLNIPDNVDGEKNKPFPSRSAKKRESAAMQKIGENLIKLKPETRKTLPISEDLASALAFHDQLTDREAKRRQRQYIGKLMRDADVPAIMGALEKLESPHATQMARFHAAESWREKLLNVDLTSIRSAIDEFFIFFNIKAENGEVEDLESLVKRYHGMGGEKIELKRNLFRLLLSILNRQDAKG